MDMDTDIFKVTVGYVVQTYDKTGKCVESKFIAGTEVSYENEIGEALDNEIENAAVEREQYFGFDMVQPV